MHYLHWISPFKGYTESNKSMNCKEITQMWYVDPNQFKISKEFRNYLNFVTKIANVKSI